MEEDCSVRCSAGVLSRHLQVIVKFCAGQDFVQVATSGLESLVVEFISSDDKATYSFNFSSDYPDNTVVSCSNDSHMIQHHSQPLPVIFSHICSSWCTAKELTIPTLQFAELCLPMNIQPNLQRQVTSGSMMSAASSEYTEGSEIFSDDMDYYDGAGCVLEGDVIHSLLEHDIEYVAAKYGANAVDSRVHAGINEIDIVFCIDIMAFLDSHTASAWNVSLDQPIMIQLHLQSASEYLDGSPPQVEVYQGTLLSKEKKKFGLGGQIQKIMETFLISQWKKTSNSRLQTHMDMLAARKLVKPMTVDDATPTNPHGSDFSFSDDEALCQMIDMGFDLEESQIALRLFDGKIDEAIDAISSQDPNLLHALEVTPTVSQKQPLGSNAVSPTEEVRQLDRQDSHGAQIVLTSRDEDVKTAPSLDHGFLAQCLQYALNRIPSLNEFCVICDERHVLETGLIRPCVCTRELCVFAFQTLGVMSDSAESIATDGSVVDLLIAMANAAACSGRAELILDPYPSIVNPSDHNILAMDPKAKDFELVATVMVAIINARKQYVRGKCGAGTLKEVMDHHHYLAFSLMQWIVATNRSHIVLLPEEKRLPSIKTKYQFLLISSPPAKEAAFQEAKRKHGSTYAFHGSRIENWHSIMRKGLINASGTKLQLNGAAYGHGIYLSPNLGLSFGYSSSYAPARASSDSNDTLAGKTNILCIALCEVITNKELKKCNDVWVCANPDNVVTRFFFVYENDGRYGSRYASTNEVKFRQEIISALKK